VASTAKLLVVVGSTRPGRVSPAIAEWFLGHAAAHESFDAELVDLRPRAPVAG
jgi:NAD(P)H-dependent FMN reductase